MKTTQLFGAAVLVTTFAAGCTGQGLPTSTNPGDGNPAITGRITKDGQPVSGRTVFLKQFNGVSEGSYANATRVSGVTTQTRNDGTFTLTAPADAVTAGALFGVGYDAGDANAANKSAQTLTDEIQWFTSPAINLSTKTGKTANVNFDIGWAISGFNPSNGSVVNARTVNFTMPAKSGATRYEVIALNGNAAGTGTRAFSGDATTPSITWSNASNGTYNWTAKYFTGAGAGGVDLQASSPALVFTVNTSAQ